jgi:hypothetical protein
MENIKLIKLLSTFSKSEMKEFEKFLHMSYLSSERNLFPLFGIIKKYYSDYENLSVEKIYKELFKKEKPGVNYLRTLIADLYKTAKNFIVFKQVMNDKPVYNEALAREFLERNLEDEFERQHKKADEVLENEYSGDRKYFGHKAGLDYLNTSFLFDKKNYDNYKNSYQDYISSFSMSFLKNLYYYYPEIYLFKRKNILNHEFNLADYLFNVIDFDKIQQNLTEIDDKQKIILKMTHYTAILDLNNSLEVYNEAKKLFFDNYAVFDKGQKQATFFRFINFCSIQISAGNYKIHSEVFDLNKRYLADGDQMYLENGFFNKRGFRNMVITALHEGEYEWTINFINNYKQYLKEEAEDNLVNHNLAMTYYRMGDLDKSLEVLSRVKFNFGTYKEEITLLKAIVLYEKGFYQETLELLQSFKKTFRKTSVMTENTYFFFKNSVSFFINFLNIVLKQKYSELDFFEQKLNECKIISIKPWLQTKISELKSKK